MSFIKKDYVKDFIVRLTVSRPEVLNALNIDVIQELDDSLKDCINDDKVGVIILTGEGDKAFIAGADIKKMKTMNKDQAYDFGRKGQNLTKTIETSPKPVIAAVNGFALGGGCEISLACHIRVASDSAKFGQPEVLLGILPGCVLRERVRGGITIRFLSVKGPSSIDENKGAVLTNSDFILNSHFAIRARFKT